MVDRKTDDAKEDYVVVDNAVGMVMDKQANLSDDESSMEQSLNMFEKVITMLIIINTFWSTRHLFF